MSLLKFYKHSLVDDFVFNCINGIVTKAKNNKSSNNELLDLIADFERKINAYHNHQDPDDDETVNTAATSNANAAKPDKVIITEWRWRWR